MRPLPSVPTEFRLTPFQERILLALEGRALHTEDLVREIGDPQQFFAGHGGIWELRHWGLVVHDGESGNYRPDRPPAEMAFPDRAQLVLCVPPTWVDDRNEGPHPYGSPYLRHDRPHGGVGTQGRHSFPSRRGRE